MKTDFTSTETALNSPARKAFDITPNDSTDLTFTTRGIYTGTGGTIVCILASDSVSVTLSNVPSGTVLPLCVKRVLATGTTSSMNLVGLV